MADIMDKIAAQVNRIMAPETKKVAEKRTEFKSWVDSFPKVEGRPDMKSEDLVEFHKRNDDLNNINKDYESKREVVIAQVENEEAIKSLNAPVASWGFGDGSKPDKDERHPSAAYETAKRVSVGRAFTESQEYKNFKGKNGARYDVEIPDVSLNQIKAVISTTSGFAPFNARIDDVVPLAGRRPTVADLMPNTDTTASAIIYMEQTTRTNNSAPVAEGATKPQSVLVWTQRTVGLEVIAHLQPVTEQELEDVPSIRDVIDQELTYMLQLTEEDQILNGDGNSPNLQGILTKSGVQTQAKGSDPVPDAIYKAFTLVRFTGFAEPSGVVMHPNDWQDVRLLRTADGLYIWGNPSEAGPERIWGKPVVVTTAMTENTALTGDFQMYTRLYRKGGIRIGIGYVNDDWAKNLQTIRCEERAALVIRRASAFAKVTSV